MSASDGWRFPERGSTDWRLAWEALAAAIRERGWGDGTDLAQWDKPKSEAWMFDGIDAQDRAHFRHRNHPVTGRREILRLAMPRPAQLRILHGQRYDEGGGTT